MSTEKMTEPQFWLAFNTALKVELKKTGVYKPESLGDSKADNTLVAIRDEWIDEIHRNEQSLYRDFKTPTDAAKACAAWQVESRLTQSQEHTTDNEKPLFGMMQFAVDLVYSGGGYEIPFSLVLTCTPSEFPYESIRLIRELDTEYKKFNMARVRKEKPLQINQTLQAPLIGEDTVKRMKITEIHHNSDKGKSQWRALTAEYQPYGIPVYPETVPEEWKEHLQMGTVTKTDKWEIDVLMKYDDKDAKYKAKKVVACYLVTPTGV